MSNHLWLHFGIGIQIDATPIPSARIVCELILTFRAFASQLAHNRNALKDDSQMANESAMPGARLARTATATVPQSRRREPPDREPDFRKALLKDAFCCEAHSRPGGRPEPG